MIKPVRIALDAMGGDHGPDVIVPGAARALRLRRDMKFLFFGDAVKIQPLLDGEPGLSEVSTLRHTGVSVRMDAKP
ncbi:MAG: phosphate acyltransferase PlsX, partial [Methylocella sp.]